MNKQQFIAKQQVKYYWKALKQATHLEKPTFSDDMDTAETFWEYEQTPRTL